MQRFTLGQKFRYNFDNLMAKGTPALVLLLAGLSTLLIFMFAGIVVLFGIQPEGDTLDFWTAAWASLMRAMDSGTVGGDTGTFALLMLGMTIGGIFILSALIGVLNAGLEAKLDELRRGRSFVAETGHIIILGWSDQIFTVINELVEANRSQGRFCIVIMAPRDKTVMEEEVKDKITLPRNCKIVCRNGNPFEVNDIALSNPNAAKAIILLSNLEENSDTNQIKVILALVNFPERKQGPFHIICQLRDQKNERAARIAGKGEVEIILVGDMVARVLAQTCRQPGLSAVYTELLDFKGQEIYVRHIPTLAGRTYGDLLMSWPRAIVFGLVQDGQDPCINPPKDTVIGPKDKVVLIAEDDSAIGEPLAHSGLTVNVANVGGSREPSPEDTLIIGWNWKAEIIIRELNSYSTKGSHITVVMPSGIFAGIDVDLYKKYENISINWVTGDTRDRGVLDGLDILKFDHVILLCYSDHMNMEEADGATLTTLLHLRDIQELSGKSISIVSEMLNIQNRELAEVAKVNDFIVSEKLVSLLIAQVAEEKSLNKVFADVFDPDGSEIYLKNAMDYVHPGTPVDFYQIVAMARDRGETAIGYKLAAYSSNKEMEYGIVINPNKSKTVVFSPDDQIIVAADHG